MPVPLLAKDALRSGWKDAIALSAYVIGTAVYTLPLVFDLSRPFSAPGDYLLIIYGLSWQIHALLTQPWDFFQANVMYPASSSLAIATPLCLSQLIFFAPARVLSQDPIVAINCVYLGNILLTALSTYVTLRMARLDPVPAFVAGWAFAFSVPKLHQNFQLPFFWLVWLSYAWYRYLCTHRKSWLLLSAFFFIGMSLGSFYLMYMGFLCLLVATLIFHWKVKPFFKCRNLLKTTAVAALVALILLPFGLPYFEVNRQYNLRRTLGEAIQYSADPIGSYLVPQNDSFLYQRVQLGNTYAPLPGEATLFKSIVNLLGPEGTAQLTAGKFDTDLSLAQFHSIWSSGSHERRLFPGYSVLVLALLAAGARPPPGTRNLRLLLGTLLATSVLLSLGPVIVVLGHLTYIPGPYLALYHIVPGLEGMRATARFGHVALLSLSGLSALGWSIASRRFLHGAIPAAVALASWLTLFSLEHYPAKSHAHDRPQDPPPVYAYLATQDIEGGLIELPTFKGSMDRADPRYGHRRIEYRHREYRYMYYSTLHWQPIYNGFGAFVGPHQFAVRNALSTLPDTRALEFLHTLGLKTLVLHTYWFDEEEIAFWSRPEVLEVLEPVASVDGAEVYRLASPRPAPTQ